MADQNTAPAPSATEPKVDGKAFDDFFDSIGNRAQKVEEKKDEEEEDDQRVVDEIESLCMNCHANVRPPLLLSYPITPNSN